MDNEIEIAWEIKNGKINWTVNLLKDLLGPRNYWRIGGQDCHWEELRALLTNKLLLMETTMLPNNIRIPIRGEQDYEQMQYLKISPTSSDELIRLRWIALKWLEQSHESVETYDKYIDFSLPDETAFVKVGGIDVSRLLNDYLQPGGSFYHIPLSESRIVYIIRTTDKYKVYYEERKKLRFKQMQDAAEKIDFGFLS